MPPPSPLRDGDLVGLLAGGQPQLAVIQSIDQRRCELSIGASGRRDRLPLRDLERIQPCPDAGPIARRLADPPWLLTADRLEAACPRRRDLASAWLLLAPDTEAPAAEQSLDDLLALVGSADDPAQRAALWLWLHSGQLLFRSRQGRLAARSLNDLRSLRRQRHREALAERRQQHWHGTLRLRRPLQATELGPAQQRELELLMALAAGTVEPTGQQPTPELRRALQAAHCSTDPGALRHLLVDLGQWEPHHLPALAASPWQQGFSELLLAEAHGLVAASDQPQPGDGQRIDLTSAAVVTIDDEDTLDIDDGLSLDRDPDGRPRLWVHVADPGRLVAAGSPLDLEARRRGSSLYLARGVLPMFPEPLAHGPFSLRAGHRCAAWSLWVVLEGDGAVAASGIQPSWVCPTYRLSYDDADELIELAPPQEAALVELAGLLERRRQWRLARGAVAIDQPEGRVRARADEARLEITEPSPSRQMVAEAMILAGAVVADLGARHHLALPYRSQLPCELPAAADLQLLAPGPVRHAAIRRCLSRGHMGTTPSPHFSLGLPAYVQATSPIRRYGDLLVQRQLRSLQDGRPPLQEAELAPLLQELEDPLRQGQQISRDDQRHWLQVWFAQRHQHQWRALFLRWLRPQDRLALVHAEDLALDLAAEAPAGSEPGDALLLRVVAVDPLRDCLRLEASA